MPDAPKRFSPTLFHVVKILGKKFCFPLNNLEPLEQQNDSNDIQSVDK